MLAKLRLSTFALQKTSHGVTGGAALQRMLAGNVTLPF